MVSLIATSTLHLFALLIRAKRNGRRIYLFDYFYIFLGFHFLYVVGGQLTIMKYDHFGSITLDAVSLYVLLSSLTLCVLTPLFPKATLQHFADENQYGTDLISTPFLYLVTGAVLLIVGYMFWYLNYSRIGGLAEGFFEFSNRVDRNAQLTKKRFNLPFVHFLFAGQCFLFYGLLLYKRHRLTSVALTLLACAPILLFFFFEGERSSLLKHALGLCIVDSLTRKAPISLRTKYVILIALLFFAFAVIGNIRGHLVQAILTADPGYLIERISHMRLALFIPAEFSAILFTLKETIWMWQLEGLKLGYGYTYWQSLPYLMPRSVYDLFFLVKSQTLADQFASDFAASIGNTRKMGFGMSPLAESFYNFSWMGSVLGPAIILAFSTLHSWLSKQLGVVGFATLITLPVFVLLNRTSFASCFSFFLYIVLISTFTFIAVKVFTNLTNAKIHLIKK